MQTTIETDTPNKAPWRYRAADRIEAVVWRIGRFLARWRLWRVLAWAIKERAEEDLAE